MRGRRLSKSMWFTIIGWTIVLGLLVAIYLNKN
jgi:hypothetical protein